MTDLVTSEETVPVSDVQEITLADVAGRLDMLGQQMNWLCENLTSLFGFVSAMSNNGGGIRGLMSALKQGPPDLIAASNNDPDNPESKVGA